MKSDATRQADFRRSRATEGQVKLAVWISIKAMENVDTLARVTRRTKRETVNILLEQVRV